MIQRIDLGLCAAYEYQGDETRTALALPGASLMGMPALWYAFAPLYAGGWRVILVWDEFLDRTQDPWAWTRARAEAAAAYAGDVHLVIAKSLTTRAAALAAERGWPAVWLTPLFEGDIVEALRARTAPALFVGGSADEAWDGGLARELSPDVLELDDVDHGLASVEHAARIGEAVAEFSGRLLGRA